MPGTKFYLYTSRMLQPSNIMSQAEYRVAGTAVYVFLWILYHHVCSQQLTHNHLTVDGH